MGYQNVDSLIWIPQFDLTYVRCLKNTPLLRYPWVEHYWVCNAEQKQQQLRFTETTLCFLYHAWSHFRYAKMRSLCRRSSLHLHRMAGWRDRLRQGSIENLPGYSIISISVLAFTKDTLLAMLFIDLLLNSYELGLYPFLGVATLIVYNKQTYLISHLMFSLWLYLPDDVILNELCFCFFQITIRQHLTSLSQDCMRRKVNEGSFYKLKPFLLRTLNLSTLNYYDISI